MRALRARRKAERQAVAEAAAAELEASRPVQPALPGVPQPPGPGRPPGATEIDPELWRRWMIDRYGSPLRVWGEAFAMSIPDLAAYLGCTKLEAARFRSECARLAAPFLHREQPKAIDLGASAGTLLVAIAPSLAAAWQAEEVRGAEAVQSPPIEVKAEDTGRSSEAEHSLAKGADAG